MLSAGGENTRLSVVMLYPSHSLQPLRGIVPKLFAWRGITLAQVAEFNTLEWWGGGDVNLAELEL